MLSTRGRQALMAVDGATGGEMFRIFVRQELRPILARGDIVVIDKPWGA
jgi:hypothetical protein